MHTETKSTIMTNEHTSLVKYTSHTLFEMVAKVLQKGLCERWVGDWTNWNILTFSSFAFSSTSFSFCRFAQSGVRRAHSPLLGTGSFYSILSPTNWLQTNSTLRGTGLYNCLILTCILWASHLHPIQPIHRQDYTLISSTGSTCYLHRCISYLTARLRVNMLHIYITPYW